MRVLVTGARGFIGRAVCRGFSDRGHPVRGTTRQGSESASSLDRDVPLEMIRVGSNVGITDWRTALEDVGCVVHCAGLSHFLAKSHSEAVQAFTQANVHETTKLVSQAAAAGVRRFILISSVKVLGERTVAGGAFRETDTPSPEDPYGKSKLQAEIGICEIAAHSGIEVTIVRPPLVYGPGVKGNLARLLRLVRLGVPLPLASITNGRSLVSLDNLVDFLVRCAADARAAGETFLVSDGEDISTPDLLHRSAAAMGRTARLFPVPVPLLRFAGSTVGRGGDVSRLVDSLLVDSGYARRTLGWTPPLSVASGLARMVQAL